MTEEQKQPEEQPEIPESPPEPPSKPEAAPASAPPAQPEAVETPATAMADMEEGKTFAILSYALSLIGLPFFLVPLIMRNNEFSLYHAKQTLVIWLAGIAVSLVGSILSVVCIGIIILLGGWIFLLVLAVMGLMNAIKGEAKPVPAIGKWGEDWFKGLKKV